MSEAMPSTKTAQRRRLRQLACNTCALQRRPCFVCFPTLFRDSLRAGSSLSSASNSSSFPASMAAKIGGAAGPFFLGAIICNAVLSVGSAKWRNLQNDEKDKKCAKTSTHVLLAVLWRTTTDKTVAIKPKNTAKTCTQLSSPLKCYITNCSA